MTLEPGRLGAMRGPNHSTLDSVVAAIEAAVTAQSDIVAAINEVKASVDNLALSADTNVNACGKTQSELLCDIFMLLGGEVGNMLTPPAYCPGFEGGNVVAYADDAHRNGYVVEGDDADWQFNLSGTGAGNGLTVDVVFPDVDAFPHVFYWRITASKPATNLCIVAQVSDGGYLVRASYNNLMSGGASGLDPLNSNQDTGVFTTSVVLEPGGFLDIDAHRSDNEPIEVMPATFIWVVQGAFG